MVGFKTQGEYAAYWRGWRAGVEYEEKMQKAIGELDQENPTTPHATVCAITIRNYCENRLCHQCFFSTDGDCDIQGVPATWRIIGVDRVERENIQVK